MTKRKVNRSTNHHTQTLYTSSKTFHTYNSGSYLHYIIYDSVRPYTALYEQMADVTDNTNVPTLNNRLIVSQHQLIATLYQQLLLTQAALQQNQTQLDELYEHEQHTLQNIYYSIEHNIQVDLPQHHIEFTVHHCPPSLFRRITAGWTAYTPRRRKAGYVSYQKCADIDIFLRSLPQVTTSKTFTISQGKTITMQMVATPEKPVYFLYNNKKWALTGSFQYWPNPLPFAEWKPTFSRKRKQITSQQQWFEQKQ